MVLAPEASIELQFSASPVEGYPKLAYEMGAYPETAIIRRFAGLNAMNLLYMQAELIHLENELKTLQRRDASQGYKYSQDWYWLNISASSSENSDQIEKVLTIRAKLKEYSMT